MHDRDIVEMIRQLVLRQQPDREDVAKVAQEFAQQVRSVNKQLNQCHRWIHAGLFAEAVSYGEALDLAKTASRLLLEGMFTQWRDLCHASKLPPPESIDQSLLELYSDAWSRFHSLAPAEAKHRLLSLQRAPLIERLKALRELVELDPRNPEWLRSVTRLQREAAAELVRLAGEVLQSKDDALAITVSDLVDACGGAIGEHQEQLAKLQVYAVAAKSRGAQQAARAACNDMHTAATAMNMDALRAASLRWQAAIAEFEPDADLRQTAAASLGLLQAEQDREQRQKNQRDAVARLELALDQAKSHDEIQSLVKAARNLDAMLPEAIVMRVAAVEDAQRAVGHRKFVRRGVAVAMATVVLLAAAWWIVQWQQSLEQVNSIAKEVETLLVAGAPDTASKTLATWKESHQELAGAPQVSAVGAKVAAALEKEKTEIALAQAAIDRAKQLAQTPAYPVEFDKSASELRQMAERAPKSMQPQLLAAADQMTSQAAASRTVSLDKAKAEFNRLEAALNALPMTAAEQVDPASWNRKAAEYQSIVDAAKIAASAAVTNRDAQAIAESLQALALNATRLREQAEQNAKMYGEAAELLQAVERIPASESAYRDLYVRLLPVAGDLLNRRKLLKAYEHGLKVAEGGAAVESWRQQIVPAILSGRTGSMGGLSEVDFGDAATARSLSPILAKHLTDFPTTPHAEAAQLLQGICKRTLSKTANTEGIGAAAAAWLSQSGWVNLGEQSLEDGRRIYRKRTDQMGNPWAQAVQSKNDLAVVPENLKARAPLNGKLLGVNAPWAPSQALVAVAADLPKASWRNARNLWLDMLAKQAAMQPSNPILSWHMQKDLWNAWLEYFAEERDPVDAAAAKWVRSLESLRAISASDPFVVAAGDQAARSEDVRKVALQSLSLMPDIQGLIKAAKKRDQVMDEGMIPAASVAIMLAPQDNAYPVRGIANGKDALIIGKGVEGSWRFFPVRIENNEVLFVRDTPNPIPQSPQLIFLRGAVK
ncbi:MAG: hypothetical protein K8R92_09730 [Planctomycetes bacterium]|nr:hypothetical protein [Planctomycetota bacterium]